ncbi:MAG TPA: class I SAM-dependent methyltransferase [Sphingomicrobium sp.]|nr:class I SAM-dependent methyltransferase [Sphingomicrobium sp.]
MAYQQLPTIKANVDRFDADVREKGSYAYTSEKVSARAANRRISDAIAEAYDFKGKTILDLGCGDGAYSLEFAQLGVRRVLGVDPAHAAIAAAQAAARDQGVDQVIQFEVGNIYDLDQYLKHGNFDCIILRGVLHHLPDPARAIAGMRGFDGTIIVLEPNGGNPVLKLLERFSRYHIEHEERSFVPGLIRSWLTAAGFDIDSSKVVNLVPFFCPDWMVPILQAVERPIEKLPLVREIVCGQSIIVAGRKAV